MGIMIKQTRLNKIEKAIVVYVLESQSAGLGEDEYETELLNIFESVGIDFSR